MRKISRACLVTLAVVLVSASTPWGAEAPLPEGVEVTGEKELAGGGTKQTFRTEKSARDLVDGYAKVLEGAGWTLSRQGSGGGAGGGGAELTASHGEQHLVLQAGGPKGRTFAGLCVWPKRPANDYCG